MTPLEWIGCILAVLIGGWFGYRYWERNHEPSPPPSQSQESVYSVEEPAPPTPPPTDPGKN